ncbi:MAG TPA: hypothetical protein VGB98_04355 [Pyrinomonadaceae bacterium]|jgi:hypothetical protein
MKNPSHVPKLLLLTLAVASALASGIQFPRAVSQSQPSAVAVMSGEREPHPLDALDRAVQKRFHNVIGFGMARIASERRFEPTTEEEKEAVAALRREGYSVGLYLAGRGVLAEVPVEKRVALNSFGGWPGRAIAGPIYVSSSSLKSLPGAVPLWDGTRRALESFASGGGRHEFTAGLWRVEARPVRASAESCIECHRARAGFEIKPLPSGVGAPVAAEAAKDADLKVGDPLGVLLYAYRKGR